MAAPGLMDLLERTSRTFALTIPLLAEPLQGQVRIAYLLFRIADTLEDADRLPRDPRVSLLKRFFTLLDLAGGRDQAMRAFRIDITASPPTANPDYAELLERTPEVFDALDQLPGEVSEILRRHLRRTTMLMAAFVSRADERGSLALTGLDDLRSYCYAVAGIVGEMLTEMVVLAEPSLAKAAKALSADAREFGEALQLVNILKDAGDDLKEGRTYVPASLDRAQVFALAREDLGRARRYIATLHAHGATRGTLAFHALPVRLAMATLDRVEARGPGAKMSREDVGIEIAAMHASLAAARDGLQ